MTATTIASLDAVSNNHARANRGRRSFPQARSVRKALDTIQQVPYEALFYLVEVLVDRLDALTPDPDLEDDNEDACDAGDDGSRKYRYGLAGDDVDAEFSGDEHEPDDEGHEPGSEDEPDFPHIPQGQLNQRNGIWERVL